MERCSETFAWLAEHPNVGRQWQATTARNRGIRVWPVSGFRSYLIFYRPGRDRIRILHILSGARDIERFLGP